MAEREGNSCDFYAVLGLKKECSASELRNAYKKLALRWHPDRCSASGNSKFVEEAKKKFQAIQEAYSVLSDASKRFLYDVGAYDSDDDENEMGDFLGEMAAMMSQSKPNENGVESLEELQELFDEMFQRDMDGIGSTSQSAADYDPSSCNFSCSSNNSGGGGGGGNKRDSADMNSGKAKTAAACFDFSGFESGPGFCFGAENAEEGSRGRSGGKRRNGRKQKVSSGHDVSSRNEKISA
ncbi:uncharacterized protein LOC131251797 [Magnolia sinica]|uniref:uncharacterized protein LOC131251797 n=1 Tax=Magnolia sinica TaxID=86752 RepID=UPI00265A4B7A|nr:uncharacterized protein LOC131251797 [Magnolia sinica]